MISLTLNSQNGRIFSNPVTWDALAKALPPPAYTLGTPVPPPNLAQQHAQQLFTTDYEYIAGLSAGNLHITTMALFIDLTILL